MKKLFEKIKVFLVDRFTARHRDTFEVTDRIMTPANVVTMIGIVATWIFALQVTFNVYPMFVPIIALIPALSDTVDGKLAELYGFSKWGAIIDIARDYNYTAGFLWVIWIIGGGIVFWPLVLIVVLESWMGIFSLVVGTPKNAHCVAKIHSAIQWIAGYFILVQYFWVGSFIIPIVWLVWVIVGASAIAYLNHLR
jgi:phosphatidylglycerophosphate synthase